MEPLLSSLPPHQEAIAREYRRHKDLAFRLRNARNDIDRHIHSFNKDLKYLDVKNPYASREKKRGRAERRRLRGGPTATAPASSAQDDSFNDNASEASSSDNESYHSALEMQPVNTAAQAPHAPAQPVAPQSSPAAPLHLTPSPPLPPHLAAAYSGNSPWPRSPSPVYQGHLEPGSHTWTSPPVDRGSPAGSIFSDCGISPLNLPLSPYCRPIPLANYLVDPVFGTHRRDRSISPSPFDLPSPAVAPTGPWHFAPATILPPDGWSDQSKTNTDSYYNPARRVSPEAGPSGIAPIGGERSGSAPPEAHYPAAPAPEVIDMYDHIFAQRRTPHISLLSVSPPPSNAVPQAAHRSFTPPPAPLSPAPHTDDTTTPIDIGPLPDTVPHLPDGSAPVPMHVLFPTEGTTAEGTTAADNTAVDETFAWGTKEEKSATAKFLADFLKAAKGTRGAERAAQRELWINYAHTAIRDRRRKTLKSTIVDECQRVARRLFNEYDPSRDECKEAVARGYETYLDWAGGVGLDLFHFAVDPPSYCSSPTPSPPSSPLVTPHNPFLSATANELALEAEWFKAHYTAPRPTTRSGEAAPFRPIARMRRNAVKPPPFDPSMPDEWRQAKKMALAYRPDGRERADSVFHDRDQVAQPAVPFDPRNYKDQCPIRLPKRKHDELPFPIESRVPAHHRKLPKLSHCTRTARRASLSVFETETLRPTISTYVGDAILNLRYSVWNTVDAEILGDKMRVETAAARAVLDPVVAWALGDEETGDDEEDDARKSKNSHQWVFDKLEGQERTDALTYLAHLDASKMIERLEDTMYLRQRECDTYLKIKRTWNKPPSPRAMSPAPLSARKYPRPAQTE
ncbi:uncharacterized protein LOC62_05G007401 [Vanrija pseudolonga]|uniref:Uncharacterized protein n=1 Tax=Vanrija pseudolonga TaxID=143232 RepID=A0AAF0YFX2_9TREE|nr:hypothetical protein LOC62_05G007401 [Vanrija pseudolonga]